MNHQPMNNIKLGSIKIVVLSVFLLIVSCKDSAYTTEDFENVIINDNVIKLEKMLMKVNPDTLTFFNNRNLLHIAILKNADQVINKFIKDSTLINSVDDSGSTPLHLLVMENNAKGVDLLLNQKNRVDIDMTDDLNSLTAIYYAIDNNNVALTKTLLEKGANINQKQGFMDHTPLHAAIASKNVELVKLLQSFNAIDTIKNINGDTALDLANETGDIAIIDLYFDSYSKAEKNELLYKSIKNNIYTENIPDWLSADWVDKKILSEAFVFVKNTNTAAMLLKKGVNINHESSEYKYAAIHHAAIRGDSKMLEFLLENGANVNQIDKYIRATPLMHASRLYEQSKINKQNKSFSIQMSDTVKDYFGTSDDKNRENSIYCVKFLISKGADLNFKNQNDENALYFAESSFNHDVITYLKSINAIETKKFVESRMEKISRLNRSF